MGVFAAVGVTGAKGDVSEVVSSAAVTNETAGRIAVPSFARPPPGVRVGGGGKGGPMPQGYQGDGGSVSEEVGRIVDESKKSESGAEIVDDPPTEEAEEQPRNPKKRMWEEDIEAAKEEQRRKDEL